MDVYMDRFSYADTESESVMRVSDFSLATIERPWISGFFGGRPFASCVPDGTYKLEPWIRASSGAEVYILSNPDLGVFREKKDRPNDEGRYLCLIHVANFASSVVGCVGPGLARAILFNKKTGQNERAVSNSGEAMRILTEQLGREDSHTLIIRSKCGAIQMENVDG